MGVVAAIGRSWPELNLWATGDAGGSCDGGYGCRCGRLVDLRIHVCAQGSRSVVACCAQGRRRFVSDCGTAGGVTLATEEAAVAPEAPRAKEEILV